MSEIPSWSEFSNHWSLEDMQTKCNEFDEDINFFEDRFDRVRSELEDIQFPLQVFRGVEGTWGDNYSNRHWTTSREVATHFAGKVGEVRGRLISESDVDWLATILTRLAPDFSDDEREITLK